MNKHVGSASTLEPQFILPLYLISLLLTRDVIKGKLEVMLIPELGREPDLDFLVEVGVFVVPRDRQVGMTKEFRRGGFAEDDRHGEGLILTAHELN